MSGRLFVRLEKYLLADSVEQAVVGSIEAIPEPESHEKINETQMPRFRRDLILPSGISAPLAIDLEPGRYLVEATLPSGDVASDEVQIFDGEQSSLDLRSDDSPHEWLSWQQLAGNIDRFTSYRLRANFNDFIQPFPVNPSVAYLLRDPVPPLRGEAGLVGDAWTLLAESFGSGEHIFARLSHSPPEPIAPFLMDSLSEVVDFTAEGSRSSWSPRQPLLDTRPTPRQYLIVEVEQSTYLLCIPVPWQSIGDPSEAPAQVLIQRGRDNEPPTVSTTIRDPLVGSALSYMAAGALPAAGQLFESAQQMLFEKQTNPLAAAGGGYVLLGSEQGGGAKPWHVWIKNLMNRFEWLPDGAIQHGWLKLRHRQSRDDLAEARQALFIAYRRGLPFYSIGMQWLIEGLTVFAPDDENAARMLRNVERVVWRTNLRSPFTVITLPLV